MGLDYDGCEAMNDRSVLVHLGIRHRCWQRCSHTAILLLRHRCLQRKFPDKRECMIFTPNRCLRTIERLCGWTNIDATLGTVQTHCRGSKPCHPSWPDRQSAWTVFYPSETLLRIVQRSQCKSLTSLWTIDPRFASFSYSARNFDNKLHTEWTVSSSNQRMKWVERDETTKFWCFFSSRITPVLRQTYSNGRTSKPLTFDCKSIGKDRALVLSRSHIVFWQKFVGAKSVALCQSSGSALRDDALFPKSRSIRWSDHRMQLSREKLAILSTPNGQSQCERERYVNRCTLMFAIGLIFHV